MWSPADCWWKLVGEAAMEYHRIMDNEEESA
jgi:hypothetical protein